MRQPFLRVAPPSEAKSVTNDARRVLAEVEADREVNTQSCVCLSRVPRCTIAPACATNPASKSVAPRPVPCRGASDRLDPARSRDRRDRFMPNRRPAAGQRSSCLCRHARGRSAAWHVVVRTQGDRGENHRRREGAADRCGGLLARPIRPAQDAYPKPTLTADRAVAHRFSPGVKHFDASGDLFREQVMQPMIGPPF